MKSQCTYYNNIKTVQHWATSSTSWLLFVLCLQRVYKHVWIWVIKMRLECVSLSCWAGRRVILHCKGQQSLFRIR